MARDKSVKSYDRESLVAAVRRRQSRDPHCIPAHLLPIPTLETGVWNATQWQDDAADWLYPTKDST